MKDRIHGLPQWVHVALSLVLLHHIHNGHPMALQCCAHSMLLGSHNLDKSMAAGGPGLWKAMGRPHASSPIHSPWFGAPCSGTCSASSWGAVGCKTHPMAVSAGGWNGFGKHTVLAWCYNIAYKTLILWSFICNMKIWKHCVLQAPSNSPMPQPKDNAEHCAPGKHWFSCMYGI